MNTVSLNPQKLTFLRDVDPRLVSYNIEMTEVTGGTFWKPYTPAQIAGTEEFPTVPDVRELAKLLAVFQPADLSEPRVRQLAKALGPVYIRVSGSWATTTYYDFDGHTGGKAPEGFRAVLTRQQWEGVLDFVKYVDAKLLISVANCDGVMDENHCWDPAQAKLLFDFSRDYGVPISAVEFMNEPNTTVMSRTHASYTAQEFCRDQDAFYRFVRENYPDVVIVGPCASGDAYSKHTSFGNMSFWPTSQLLEGCREHFEITEMENTDTIEEQLTLLYEQGKKAFAFYCGGDRWQLLVLKDLSVMAQLLPDKSEASQGLDVTVLHSLVLEKLMGIDKENMANQVNLTYTRSMEEALASVQNGESQCAFLLNPTRVTEIRDVAAAGEKMPQKSTYFYPKLITGLVMNEMEL